MKNAMNLQQIIYQFLIAQIKFGAYSFGTSLPAIEETSLWFSVSLDTVRGAYLRLKKEKFITLTKKRGAIVAVRYNDQEIEQHIQLFFSQRRNAVIDLCHASGSLFSHAQWFSLKNASPEQLDILEHICTRQDIPPTHKLLREVHLIYSTLNNDLLLRLVWQAFMFFQGPFLSLPQNIAVSEIGDPALSSMIKLCRQQKWEELWCLVKIFQEQLSSAICQFYEDRIIMDDPGEPIAFCWNAYEKSSQHRYSLAIELLKDIRHGLYPEKTLLPSPAKIAEAKQVSVITIRRTLALLNQLGATQSINGIGTKVLKAEDSSKNCDFTQPILHKRLSDFAQSLQILSLTCKGVAETALKAMDIRDIQHWKKRLLTLKRIRRHESVVFDSLEIVTRFTPLQSVKEIYEQLLQLLLWGYPLRGMHGSMSVVNEFYLPHINSLIDCLERQDNTGTALGLEALLCYETEFAITHIRELGISTVTGLVIPDIRK